MQNIVQFMVCAKKFEEINFGDQSNILKKDPDPIAGHEGIKLLDTYPGMRSVQL